jgi:5-(carboxyamino)imidazole ribonucleotide synthase
MPASSPLPPGSVIGILGGGQLGRMLCLAAANLGFKTHVFAPEGDSPAFDVAAYRTIADYGDQSALAAFAQSVHVVTFEFENVPVESVTFIDDLVPVRPGAHALAQDHR